MGMGQLKVGEQNIRLSINTYGPGLQLKPISISIMAPNLNGPKVLTAHNLLYNNQLKPCPIAPRPKGSKPICKTHKQ